MEILRSLLAIAFVLMVIVAWWAVMAQPVEYHGRRPRRPAPGEKEES